MVYRGVGNINNYNSLWLLVYKKLRIIQSYPQPFLKASTNSHRLRNFINSTASMIEIGSVSVNYCCLMQFYFKEKALSITETMTNIHKALLTVGITSINPVIFPFTAIKELSL